MRPRLLLVMIFPCALLASGLLLDRPSDQLREPVSRSSAHRPLDEAQHPAERIRARPGTSLRSKGAVMPQPEIEPVVKPGHQILGRVTASETGGAGGLTVGIVGPGLERTLTTDPDGRFQIDRLRAGEYGLYVEDGRGATAEQAVRLTGPGGVRHVRLVLQAGPRLILLVRDPAGSPVRSFRLRAVRLSAGFGPLEIVDRTFRDVEQRLPIDDLPPGAYQMLVVTEDATSPLLAVELRQGETREVSTTLTSPSRIAGVLVDLASGQPVPGAAIRLLPLGQGGASDRTGHFEIPVPAGKWSLDIRAPEHAWKVVHAQVRPGATTDLGQVVLSAGARVRVQVRQGERPVPGKQVLIVGRNGYRGAGQTDVHGWLSTDPLPPGRYTFAVTTPEVMVTRQIERSPAKPVTLQLGGRHRVVFHLRQAGRPAGGVVVRLVPLQGEASSQYAGGVSDVDGSVRIDGVRQPGGYAVMLAVPSGDPPAPGNSTSLAYAIQVRSALEEFRIDLAGEALRGTVIDASSSRALGGTRITLLARAIDDPRIDPALRAGIGATATTDSRGSFSCRALPPGAYHMRVERRGYRPVMRTVSVPGGHVTVLLDRALAEHGTIGGVVLDERGRRVVAVLILEDLQHRPVRRMIRTGIDGEFAIDDVAPGAYWLAAEGQADRFERVRLTVHAGKTTRVRLDLRGER